jgi:hypothetical protein
MLDGAALKVKWRSGLNDLENLEALQSVGVGANLK